MQGKLIDVRENAEFASGHIPGATLVPLGTLRDVAGSWDPQEPLTLVCEAGRRAQQGREMLVAAGFISVDVLPGGMVAWRAANQSASATAMRPWAMERQVRVVAGMLILITLTLGFLLSRYFLLGTAFVGAGLVFAGVSDICMMGSLLERMPWNSPPRQTR